MSQSDITMDGSNIIDFRNKRILAPMVRVGTLPMRLLALDQGADLVYCEEIIDFKIINAKRFENETLGTLDFTLSDGTVVFRTCNREKSKVIFQLGTADAKRALISAKKVEDCIAAVDVNMGCPKEFSIKGGMGAALLKKPEKVKEILTTLVNNLSIPVTCKIRVLPSLEDTLNLVKLIESTGVVAIAIHARTQSERPRHPNRNDYIKKISESLKIPVIANGGSKEINCYKDIEQFWKDTGASSVMLARAAQWNVSIFNKNGMLSLPEVIREYVKYAIRYDSHYANTKYCVLQMMHEDMDMEEGQKMLGAMSLQEISEIWNLSKYYEETLKTRQKRSHNLALKRKCEEEPLVKKRKSEDGKTIIEMAIRYNKRDYPLAITPKMRLFEWTCRNKMKAPIYCTVERPDDRCFHTVLTVEDTKYTTPFWEKSKQLSEQNAAVVCLLVAGVHDGRKEGIGEERRVFLDQWQKLVNSENDQKERLDNESIVNEGKIKTNPELSTDESTLSEQIESHTSNNISQEINSNS
ncbi:tRNA-dihydrouridine20 synthase NADP+-like [Octopus vulgaris]|uniref:tRNA-dihydrouridine20 synthase NADP+-like n=3 Tax=Octopus vulgaris TaxID=6645 RepID=A0AA36F0H9_OCTVU|nr:tRNA-dihydrouridine20 synthase NADP+-like [Octopus vulgaris]